MTRRRRRGFVDSLNVVAAKPVRRRIGRPTVKVVVRRQPDVLRGSSSPVIRSALKKTRIVVRGPKRPLRPQRRNGLDAFGPVISIGDVLRTVPKNVLRKAEKCASRHKRREVLFALDLRRKGSGGSRKPKSMEKC